MNLINALTFLVLLVHPALSSKFTITIPPSPVLPNPHSLPADTHATLTSTSLARPLKAPLTRSATFVFSDLAAAEYKDPYQDNISGSYLLDIRSAEYVFAPLRVDLDERGEVKGVWETFRGNEWGNRGPEKYIRPAGAQVAGGTGEVVVEARAVGRKGFYEVRQTCMWFPQIRLESFWVERVLILCFWLNSLASVASQKSHDSACTCGAGFHLWDAQAHGE
jgi:hypothetical protein